MTRVRKKIIMLLSILCVLPLTGCGAGREEARFERFRASLTDSAVTVTAEVTARDADTLSVFTLRCAETPEGCALEVLAPEEIAGVKARLADGEAKLQFDDLILPMPQAADTVSPLMALPLVLQAARTGFLDLVWDADGLTAQLITDDDTAVRITFDENDLPVSAEIDVDGRTCAFCAITAWDAEERNSHEPNDKNLGGDQP